MLVSPLFELLLSEKIILEPRQAASLLLIHQRSPQLSFQSGEFQAVHRDMVLDFKDEGCEITSEQLKNIYDPLYSNKKDAVGLGLSIVYQTVNENSFLKFFYYLRGLMMVFFY
jgi:nitrogen-specific signal transduction histidine kinase